jgi:hypothetical protein
MSANKFVYLYYKLMKDGMLYGLIPKIGFYLYINISNLLRNFLLFFPYFMKYFVFLIMKLLFHAFYF